MFRLNLMMITLLLLASLLSFHLWAHMIEGRMLLNVVDVSSTNKSPKITKEEKVMIGGQIMGSRPPRCKGRWFSCGGNCVAVQVPSIKMSNIEYARGEETSDYKPITWKCKCGPCLFNP